MRGNWHRVNRLLGMDDGLRPEPAYASLIEEMQYDPMGFWRQTAGYAPVASGFTGGREIDSLHWFRQHGGRRSWMLYEERISDTTVRLVWRPFIGSLTIDQIGPVRRRAVEYGMQFLDFNNWVYYIDGINQPSAWNGLYEDRAGFDGPAASPGVSGNRDGADVYHYAGGPTSPYDTDQRGVGEIPLGTVGNEETFWRYGFVLTQINARGQESPASAMVFAKGSNFRDLAGAATEANNIGRRSVRVQIPRAPENVLAQRLWRTVNLDGIVAGQGVFPAYLVKTFHTGGQVDYVCEVPDPELGEELDQTNLGPWPTSARLLAFWRGRFWLGGMTNEPHTLRYSAAARVEQFPTSNLMDFAGRRLGSMTALIPTAHALLVAFEDGLFAVKQGEAGLFTQTTLSTTIGISGPQAHAEIPNVGHLFVHRSGPYLLVGAREEDGFAPEPRFIGRQIQKQWRDVGLDQLFNAQVEVRPEAKEVWVQLPKGGDPRPSLGLVFHYEPTLQGGWSVRTDWPIGCMAQHRGKLFFGSWDAPNHLGVHVVSDGFSDKDGDAISTVYRTAPLYHEEAAAYQQLALWVVATGGDTFTVQHRSNLHDAWVSMRDTDKQLKQQEEPDRDRWGTAAWSATELWSDYEPARVPIHVTTDRGMVHQFELGATRINLMTFEVLYDGGQITPHTLDQTS